MSILLRVGLVLAAIGAALAAFVGLLFVRESVRRRLFPIMRPLYQRVLNPQALRAADRGETQWGVVHHVGRHSGVQHRTPVDAQRTADGVVIPLVYGPQSDWCRNILAAGRCTLTLGGQQLELNEPRIVAMVDVVPLVSNAKARFWRRIGIERCLSLTYAG